MILQFFPMANKMKPSNRKVFYDINRLTSTLSRMSNEFEEMMRHYEKIRETALDLAIAANQIRVFTDAKRNSTIAMNRFDRNGQLLKTIHEIQFNITLTESMGVRPENYRTQIFTASFETLG